jgi:hypothetical protein
MTSERASGIAFVLIALLGIGCADFSRGPAAPGVDAGTSEGGASNPDAALSFAADVHGILAGTCQRCHTEGGEAGDTTFLLTGDVTADLTATARFVDVNAPASSRVLAKMAGHGHGGGTLYAAGTPEYETVLHWIQEGARP